MALHYQDYGNPTTRVAVMCISSVKSWFKRERNNDASGLFNLTDAQIIQQLVIRLVRQMHKQGVTPNELNSDDGFEALQVVADVLERDTPHHWMGRISGALAYPLLLITEWRYVLNETDRLLHLAVQDKWFRDWVI